MERRNGKRVKKTLDVVSFTEVSEERRGTREGKRREGRTPFSQGEGVGFLCDTGYVNNRRVDVALGTK